ncbi:hypothetical protein N7453_000495 [Penicillium expansum]|nr:hypothetical protein N7453_000495 [Penicillium expansum]
MRRACRKDNQWLSIPNTDPSPPGGVSILPEEIDPEGGSDGEQLDASLTVFSDKDKGQVRDGRSS